MIDLQSGITVQQVSYFTLYTFLRLCTIPVISSKPATFQHCCVFQLHTQRDLHRLLCFYTQRHLDVCRHNSVQKNLGFFRNLTLLSKSWFNLIFSFMPIFLVLGIEPRPSSESFATSSNDVPITPHEDAISRNRQFFALATATKPCPIKPF